MTKRRPLGRRFCRSIHEQVRSDQALLFRFGNEIIKKRLLHDLNRARVRPKAHTAMEGIENL
ncbi:MAG: hypothetical protein IJI40_05275, partial [Firmicutes bacterium]|nr:hypothetical protein [Bacillota bacterium]